VQISWRRGITQTGMGSFIEDASHLLVLACCVVGELSLLRSVSYHRTVTFGVILGGDKAVYAIHASVEFSLIQFTCNTGRTD
jgi:hypothetical protein